MPSKCSCGTWNNDSANYCRNCGKKLPQQNNSTTDSIQKSHEQSSTGQAKKMSTSSLSGSDWEIVGKIFLTILSIAAFIGISIASGGIGAISGVVLVPLLKQIWD